MVGAAAADLRRPPLPSNEKLGVDDGAGKTDVI